METSLASRLAHLRAAAELTPAELARLAGLKNPSHIGMIERGERTDIAGSTAVEIARVLGTSAEYLVAGRGAPPATASVRIAVAEARRTSPSTVARHHAPGPIVVRDGYDQRTGTEG